MVPRRPLSDESDTDDWDGSDWSEELYDPELYQPSRLGQDERVIEPDHFAGMIVELAGDGYTEDWFYVSSRFRLKHNYRCQLCNINLSGRRDLLHTHHNNQDKTDNSESNLMALCVLCHASMKNHEHMLGMVLEGDRQYIERLRGLMRENKDEV